MDLIREEVNKKIFVDGEDKIYSMVNMGSYVGHKHRQWYESAPEMWTLMFYDEKRDDGQNLHMESLIDDSGNYTRFLIELGNQTRAIQIHNGRVYSDTITDYGRELGDSFVALDGDIYSSGSIPLRDYLITKPKFSSGDQLYEGELSNNDMIANFLNKDNELRESITDSKKR